MSVPAIYEALERLIAQDRFEAPYADAAQAAVDALVAENRRLNEEIRLREESQIPVIPHGAAVQLERLQVENQRLREALEAFANPQHWGVTRDLGQPVPTWIGTYRQSPVDFARSALGDTTE